MSDREPRTAYGYRALTTTTHMPRPLLAAAAALAFAGGIAAGFLLRPEPLSLTTGTLLEPPRAVAPFNLQGPGPDTLDAAAMTGQWSLVFFGFTRCPDLCPTTLQLLSDARERVAANGVTPPRILLVTVDPEFDTLERMTNYVAYFGEGITGATGSPEAIAAVAGELGIVYRRVPMQGFGYTMDHSGAVLLIGPDLSLRAVFSPPFDVPGLVQDLTHILESES
ncbi:MAG: SCO family protein [Pseudomonadota bacterium]